MIIPSPLVLFAPIDESATTRGGAALAECRAVQSVDGHPRLGTRERQGPAIKDSLAARRRPFVAHPSRVADGHTPRGRVVVIICPELEERQTLPCHRFSDVVAQTMEGTQVIIAAGK